MLSLDVSMPCERVDVLVLTECIRPHQVVGFSPASTPTAKSLVNTIIIVSLLFLSMTVQLYVLVHTPGCPTHKYHLFFAV